MRMLTGSQAWDFIDQKPDKLLTQLTETGGGFSGGQMQSCASFFTQLSKDADGEHRGIVPI